jgi:TRAP-type transport system periplasmic protein
VRKRTNGEVVCETFWGTLGGEQTLLNGVALGTLDGYHGAYTGMREFDLFFAADLFRDYEHAARVVNGPLRPKLAKALEAKYKVHLLGLGRAGSFGLQLKTPVSSWADVRDKKVRGGPLEGIIESIKAVGANAVPMAFNEVYTALQQGVVDGQVNLNTLIMTMKYFEVVKYWISNEFGLGFDKVVISQRAWNRIKPPHRKMMQELFFELETKEVVPGHHPAPAGRLQEVGGDQRQGHRGEAGRRGAAQDDPPGGRAPRQRHPRARHLQADPGRGLRIASWPGCWWSCRSR